MNVSEAHRTRNLVIVLSRGDELPDALVRALDEAEARSAWITGLGTIESAEIALPHPGGQSHHPERRSVGAAEVIALSGNVALRDGVATLRLDATFARAGELGVEVFGGQLLAAQVGALELHVVAFDDLSLHRSVDERTGLPALVARAAAVSALTPPPPAAPLITPPPERVAPPERTAPPTPPPATPQGMLEAAVLPQRIQKPQAVQTQEIYPDVGDTVNHFAFGDCTVIGSDGDRIRLRQEKEGRVREVALAMLKIEAPTVTAEGTRHFKLLRKN